MPQQFTGTVVSTKMLNTVKVVVTRRWTHPLYKKTTTKRKNYLADCHLKVKNGDRVVLTPVKPVSKLKKWAVSQVL